MTFRDQAGIALANLWRMKLRAGLTIAGIVIAIATFTSMLSFGVGNQQYVEEEFNNLGLFSIMQVYPTEDDSPDDSASAELNDEGLQIISEVPGVDMVCPLHDFRVTASVADSHQVVRAQPLPVGIVAMPLYSRLAAGEVFQDDSSRQAIITADLARAMGYDEPDSIIDQPLALSVQLSSLDSGLVNIFKGLDSTQRRRLRSIRIDSLMKRDYAENVIRRELGDAAQRFFDGYMNAQMTVSDTVQICGVLDVNAGGRARVGSVILPIQVARHLTSGGTSSDPTDLINALNSGALFAPIDESNHRTYRQATITVAPGVSHITIADSVEALGYRVFSYAQEFDEISKFFVYFDLGLAVLGVIALITASLGIINTLLVSILERTREIGVMKSLGADDRDIRVLFLVESAVIGLTGSIVGVVVGWLATRIASAVARAIMAGEGVDLPEVFALPIWLIALAVSFGTLVSLLAGWYPSRRAARIDPVEALRSD